MELQNIRRSSVTPTGPNTRFSEYQKESVCVCVWVRERENIAGRYFLGEQISKGEMAIKMQNRFLE